jgi:hypothetical protein
MLGITVPNLQTIDLGQEVSYGIYTRVCLIARTTGAVVDEQRCDAVVSPNQGAEAATG